MINIATLTGACPAAIGEETAGLFSNDLTLQSALMRAGKESGEPLWPVRIPSLRCQPAFGPDND